MQRVMLKSKIHRARLTGVELDYEGSISIDEDLLDLADIVPGEQVHVLNVNNGARLVTYAIAAPRGSGTVLLNGPAARMGMAGDLVVILSYVIMLTEPAHRHLQKIVYVDEANRPAKRGGHPITERTSHESVAEMFDFSSHTYYFNDAATSWPKAPGVIEVMQQALEVPPMHPGRDGGALEVLHDRCPVESSTDACRERLARLLAVDTPGGIALTTSVTHALNLALWGLGLTLPHGAQIISSVAEHNSVLRPLRHLLKWRSDLHLHLISLNTGSELDETAFERALTPHTALVALIHASNVTGHVYDVAPLFARAHAVGAITLLDASQSMGHLPVCPHDLHADLVAFPGHKGLRGPVGVGGLYVASGIDLEPIFVGGTGGQSDVYYQPEEMPTHLEAGTPNQPAIAGFNAALRWHEEDGAAFIARERHLALLLREGLRRLPGVRLYDDHPEVRYVPVVSFCIDRQPVVETGRRLYHEYGIICRAGLHCAPLLHDALGSAPDGTVRFSISGHTTEEEIEYALKAIRVLSSAL